MQCHARRDGATAITDDANDLLIVEPTIASFMPAKDTRCPRCSGKLAHRRAIDGQYEVVCLGCHAVLARVELGTKVHG
jgi:hypothetical protein